jgi:hypothetical protein
MKEGRLSTSVFVIGTAVAVVLVGVLAALVTWIFHPHSKPPCTIDCPPPELPASVATAPLMAEQQTFTSSDFGFQVDYTDDWKLKRSSGSGALFSTRYGELEVVGLRTSSTALQLIEQRIGKFDSADLPDLREVGAIRGAHIGSIEGEGELYSATFTPSSGSGRSLLVRIAIVVARKGDTTVLATALVPYDQKAGRVLADDVDYAMTEFRWRDEP